MTNIFDVAQYILHAIGGEMSTMKLQKLCYYCQAWHLAWHGTLMFPEDFERWNNGPVCRKLFDAKPTYLSISEKDTKRKYLSPQGLSFDKMRVIDQIMEDYGMYNGAQLEELVYREDPWKNTPEMGIISNGEIEKYYKGLLEKDRPEVAMSEDPLVYHSIDAMFKSILGDEYVISIHRRMKTVKKESRTPSNEQVE